MPAGPVLSGAQHDTEPEEEIVLVVYTLKSVNFTVAVVNKTLQLKEDIKLT